MLVVLRRGEISLMPQYLFLECVGQQRPRGLLRLSVVCLCTYPHHSHRSVAEAEEQPSSAAALLPAHFTLVCSHICRSVAEAEEQHKADLIAAIVHRREAKRAALMPEPAPTPPSTPSGGGDGSTAAAASALVRCCPHYHYRGTAVTLGGPSQQCPLPLLPVRWTVPVPRGFTRVEAMHIFHLCLTPSYRCACVCLTGAAPSDASRPATRSAACLTLLTRWTRPPTSGKCPSGNPPPLYPVQ